MFHNDDTLPEDPVESEKLHTGKKVGDSVVFKPGNCVFVHSVKFVNRHIPCRIVQVNGKLYRLCSKKGVLNRCYLSNDLVSSSCDFSIPRLAISDPTLLERCNCTLSTSSLTRVDLTGDSRESDDHHTPAGDHVWV